MAKITIGGSPMNTNGELPKVGNRLPDFELVKTDLSRTTQEDFKGSKLVLNIFPSIGTGICQASVRYFNQEASNLENTKVLCISRDLPFAQTSFCASEGLENVINLSDFETGQFSKDYGVYGMDGKFKGLSARAIVVTDENLNILYTELVPEIGQEPNYKAALAAL